MDSLCCQEVVEANEKGGDTGQIIPQIDITMDYGRCHKRSLGGDLV